jgi:hypothetical protein
VLLDPTQHEADQAFSRAAMECRFFPAPALLRELSGETMTGDAIAAEAPEELFRMSRRCVTRWTEAATHHDPIRAAGTPFYLYKGAENALVRLGWGCKTTGIALIAEHTVVAGWSAGAINRGSRQLPLRLEG